MLIFAIDDEPKMLGLLHQAISKAAPEAQIEDFTLGTRALKAIEEQKMRPDIVFSDIQMPGTDGLALAVKLKTLSPDTKLVFVTGFSEFALDAYRVHARGYVMKPVDAAMIREEIDHLVPDFRNHPEKLIVRCFGKFEVFWQNAPLQFARLQTYELFAYLIDQNGAFSNNKEIASVIWEKETNIRVLTHRLRNLVLDLRSTLERVGQDHVILKTGRTIAVDRSSIDCDYFRMLDGDMDAINSFRGEYMSQYSWASITEGRLSFMK